MSRRGPIPKRPSRITIPTRCHPAARLVFELMRQKSVTYEELAHYSGVNVTTVKSWRNEKRPGLESIESTLGVLGWRFLPVPTLGEVPQPIRAKVVELAEEWADADRVLCQLILELSGRNPFAARAACLARAGRTPNRINDQPELMAA